MRVVIAVRRRQHDCLRTRKLPQHALESRKPKARYYVTLPTYAVALFRRILPTRALDSVAVRN